MYNERNRWIFQPYIVFHTTLSTNNYFDCELNIFKNITHFIVLLKRYSVCKLWRTL